MPARGNPLKLPAIDYRRFWAAWLVQLYGSVLFWPNLMADRLVFATFFAGEAVAFVRTGKPDTLSEFMAWIDSWAKPGARWFESWRAAVVGTIAVISWQAAYVAGHGYSSTAWDRPVLGAICGATVFVWLFGHWLFIDRLG